MIKLRPGLCCFALTIALVTSFAARGQTPLPAPPAVGAKAYIMVDTSSGRVIAANNADERMEPASLTKLMTAYAAFRALGEGAIKLDDQVTISEKAWRTPGSRMFIEVGTKVSVADLLKGMIIQSGNDASVALAEYIAGTEETFASLMNQYAAELGMADSNFKNSTGLPEEEHYVTARDIATLTNMIIRSYPEYYGWYSQKEFTYNNITQHNRNNLLWRDQYVDGVKTGHTESAGYCLVTSAERSGMRLASVILGSPTQRGREDASQALLNYGFRFFETHRVYTGGEEITSARVWKGEADQVAVGLREDLYVTIPRSQYERLNAVMDLQATVVAPVGTDESIGELRLSLDDEQLAKRPLFALQGVAIGSLWSRLVDSVMLWFE